MIACVVNYTRKVPRTPYVVGRVELRSANIRWWFLAVTPSPITVMPTYTEPLFIILKCNLSLVQMYARTLFPYSIRVIALV